VLKVREERKRRDGVKSISVLKLITNFVTRKLDIFVAKPVIFSRYIK